MRRLKKMVLIFALLMMHMSCNRKKQNVSKSNFNKSYSLQSFDSGNDDTQQQTEAATEPYTFIFEYMIPDTADKSAQEYTNCIDKLDILKESINEYKTKDKDRVIMTNLPNIMKKMWYCPQTAGKTRKKVETIDDIVAKGPIEAGNETQVVVSNPDQVPEEFQKMYAKVLFGKKDFNEYLNTILEDTTHTTNHKNGHWVKFIDDKLNWIGTLIINKQRTVVTDENNLDSIFQGNKELQQIMIDNVEKQHDFFDAYIEFIKYDKKACIESLCQFKNLSEASNLNDDQKKALYFKALVYNCRSNLKSIVSKMTDNESSVVNDKLNQVCSVTDEYLNIDPEGEALAEFTKILFAKSSLFNNAKSNLSKQGNDLEQMSKESHTSVAMTNKAISGMKTLKRGLKTLGPFFIMGYRGAKEIKRSKQEIKSMRAKLKVFVRLLGIYLDFGISLAEYLRDCERAKLIKRISFSLKR